MQKKIHGSGTTALIISNEELNDIIMKIFQALKDSNIFPKGVTKTIKNETQKQKRRFLGMFLGTLGASLLGNMLAGKGKAGSGNKKGKGILRVGYGNEAASSLKELWNKKVLSKWIL